MSSTDPQVRGQVQHNLDAIKIFTDGSQNPQESLTCGSGLYVQHAGEEGYAFNIGNRTVFMAEVYAIKEAAR